MEPDASASRTSSRSVSCARRGGARQIKQINTYRIVVSRASATKVSLPDGNDKAIDPDQRGFLSRRLELPVFQTEGESPCDDPLPALSRCVCRQRPCQRKMLTKGARCTRRIAQVVMVPMPRGRVRWPRRLSCNRSTSPRFPAEMTVHFHWSGFSSGSTGQTHL